MSFTSGHTCPISSVSLTTGATTIFNRVQRQIVKFDYINKRFLEMPYSNSFIHIGTSENCF